MRFSIILLIAILSATVGAQPFELTAASFLGADGSNNGVVGTAIQSDGTVVLAANVRGADVVAPLYLNNADTSSAGAVFRLSPDGVRVKSITYVADVLVDMSLDDNDRLYLAAGRDGLIVLNPTADALDWKKPYSTSVYRVDASPSGYVVDMTHSSTDWDSMHLSNVTFHVYDPQGERLGVSHGYRYTRDVCIDESLSSIFHTGWRATDVHDGNQVNPVHIPSFRSQSYTAQVRYPAYDWHEDVHSDRYLNRPENNMADARGCRIDMGRDGFLYLLAVAAGGNHVYRYSPFDIMQSVHIVSGDKFHSPHNHGPGNRNVVFVGRFNASDGSYVLGQTFCGRDAMGKVAYTRVEHGSVMADESGRVYIGGSAEPSIPIEPELLPGARQSGPFLLILSADMADRLYLVRLQSSSGGGKYVRGIDARVRNGEMQCVWGGLTQTFWPAFTMNALQPQGNGTLDGFYAVIGPRDETDRVYGPSTQTVRAVDCQRVDLTWLDHSDTEDGFIVERKSDAAYQVVAELPVNITAFQDTTVQPETEYTYRVFSVRQDVRSTPSTEINVKTPNCEFGLALPLLDISGEPDDSLTNPVGHLIDGDLNTVWECHLSDHFFCVDLGAVYTIRNVKIAFPEYKERIHSFAIEVSMNGNEFTRLDREFRSNNRYAGLQNHYIDPVDARYVRVTAIENPSSPRLRNLISEVEVHGFETASVVTQHAGGTLAARLCQNQPNPFNASTTVRFALDRAQHARLDIFNIHGQRVATLVDAHFPPGQHDIPFDAKSLSSGLYFYHLTTDTFHAVRKMLVIK